MGHVGSKSRSLGQIIEYPKLVTKGLWFKSLLYNAIPHSLEGSVERLQGHHGPLVYYSVKQFICSSALYYYFIVFNEKLYIY